MKILIANLNPDHNNSNSGHKILNKRTLHFPTGIGIIAQSLKEDNRCFEVIDTYVNIYHFNIIKEIENIKPTVILISGFVGNYYYRYLKDIVRKIKIILPDVIIILGGPIATVIPEIIIKNTEVDYAVIGEGEKTIIELLSALETGYDVSSVNGICYARDDYIPEFTAPRKRIERLSEKTFPLYDDFPINEYISYLEKTNRCWELSASRGCINQCTFCNRIFGNKITFYHPESIVNHMIYVHNKYGINRFNFVDDNFLNNTKWVYKYMKSLQNQKNDFKWRFQGRISSASVSLISDMKKLGLFGISFGFESGSQKMLNTYKKKSNIEHMEAILKKILPIVEVNGTFIVGGPGENHQTIGETEIFIRKTGLKNINAGILTLFPGSYLYKEAVREGLIDDEEKYCLELGPVYQKPYVNLSSLSDSDLINAKNYLNQLSQ